MELALGVVLIFVVLMGTVYLMTRDKARDDKISRLTAENRQLRQIITAVHSRVQLNSDNDVVAQDVLGELTGKEAIWSNDAYSA